MQERFFSIEEARALLPELKHTIGKANKELDLRTSRLQELNNRYVQSEKALDDCQTPTDEDKSMLMKFRQQRAEFELVISELAKEQSEFIRNLEYWVDKISEHGVILRKLKEGLVDFPARHGEFEYFLCWQYDENDITHWHLTSDGFVGRKSLLTLSEYC